MNEFSVQVLQNAEFESPGWIVAWAEDRGHRLVVCRADLDERLPNPSEAELLIVLGGPFSVHDEGRLPWLARERKCVEAFLNAETPLLGICLGGQLIAHCLGAKVTPMPRREIGWHEIEWISGETLCQETRPRFRTLLWHGEEFGLPSGATRLAHSALTAVQAFRFGLSAVALQFHPEVTLAAVQALVAACGEGIQPDAGSEQSAAEILALARVHVESQKTFIYALLDELLRQR